MNFNYPNDPEKSVLLCVAAFLVVFYIWYKWRDRTPRPEPDINDDTKDMPMPSALKLIIAFAIGAAAGLILTSIF